jgi:NDP-sugar pyrophosphorylase family protein
MQNAEKTQVAILAGGLGTRLRPYTETVPKPMIDINGKPFLDLQLNNLKRQGFRKILICTGYLGHIIEDYFGDGNAFGLDISYSQESRPLGTAGAIKNAESLITSDPFFLMNGDTYWKINFEELLKTHNRMGLPLTIAIHKATNALEQELLSLNEEGIISKFYKRGTPEHMKHVKENKNPLINSGIYVMSKKLLSLIPKNENYSFENSIFPYFIGNAAGFFWEGYMKDLANIQFCRELEQDLTGGKNK